MLAYIIIAVCVVIDLALLCYNFYLYGRRVQMREDKKFVDQKMDDLLATVDGIFKKHDPTRPRYLDRQ